MNINLAKPPICPKCRRSMWHALERGGMRGRKYRCMDCEGEDPLYSPDVSKLLDQLRPPE